MTAVLFTPEGAFRSRSSRLWWYCKRHWRTIVLVALVSLLLVIAFSPYYCVSVPAGRVAVKWYRFDGGTDTETVYGEGSHFFFPWDKMAIYDSRVQQVNQDFDVLTRDGLMMTVNIALRFHLNREAVGLLHKYVGRAYVDKLLLPSAGSYAKLVFSQISTDDAYMKQRTELPARIRHEMVTDLANDFGLTSDRRLPWLSLDDALIRGIRFPKAVEEAVNRKMEEYQLKQEYAYRVEREQLESRRKEIEAQGIARFQTIVSGGISESYLRWKEIDATLALARSANTKIVVIGAGKDGMPLILGGADAPVDQRRLAIATCDSSGKRAADSSAVGPEAEKDKRE
jgi:regulator of protease activity HflC (stomatin/prohibitin superfamily)